MPNPQYGPANDDVMKDRAYDKGTMMQPSQQGKEHIDPTGQRGSKDPGGNMPMRYGTGNWKMPGEFKTQPRDRTWGMREADGVAYCAGLAKPGYEGVEGPEDTYIDRGSVSKSNPRKKQPE